MLYTVKDVPGKRIIHMESWVVPKNNAYCCARAKFPNPHKFYAEKLSWIKARKRRQYFPIKKPPDRGKGLVRKLDGVASCTNSPRACIFTHKHMPCPHICARLCARTCALRASVCALKCSFSEHCCVEHHGMRAPPV
jgi:hypothetical protein